jgi:hypothetical protein
MKTIALAVTAASLAGARAVRVTSAQSRTRRRPKMNKIMQVRQELADHWHRCGATTGALFASDDAFAAFYTSKFLIQDTAEAVWTHMEKGFSSKPLGAYIEFWGIMQALIIQQDAIKEMHKSVCGQTPNIPSPSAWSELRDLRNRCAGHPSDNTFSRKGSHVRSFMGRGFGNYERITYEEYDSASEARSLPAFNLRRLIGSYDAEAAAILSAALIEMRRRCP